MKYAVAGVSGHTGKVVADTLLAAGAQVRVIVRDPAKGEAWRARGAEVAVASLGDAAALATALEGVDGAYLLVPPSMAPGFRAYQLETGRALVAAVEQAKPKHVVLLSSIAAHLESGTGPISGLYPVEQGLRAVHGRHPQVGVTFLRAGYFMENLGMSFGALAQNILPGFMPTDTPIDMVATVDIGQTAASLLSEGPHGVQVVELGGPARTLVDAAAALTELLGRPIHAVEAPLDQLVPTFTGMGVPADIADMYREMNGGVVAGTVAWEGTGRRLLGKTDLKTVLGGLLSANG